MNSKFNKNGLITTTVIAIVLLVLLNICTFVIPFNKVNMPVHYVAYGCAEFVIIVETLLILTRLFSDEKPNQKIMSLPILYYGLVMVSAQIIATIAFYITNAFVSLPLWIVFVVEALIIGGGTIQVAKGFFFKNKNEEYHEKIADTKFMDGFRARLKTLSRTNGNRSIERELEDLLDSARGSDPITNEKTSQIEYELELDLTSLETAIKNGNEEESRKMIKKVKDTLIERNELCKIGKQSATR